MRRHLESALALDWSKAGEIQYDMTEDGEVMRGVTGAGAHLVIAKDDIHAPVQAFLHPPVLADGMIQSCSVQFRNGGLLIRLLGGCPLFKYQSGTRGKSTHQVQRCRINLSRTAAGLAVNGHHFIFAQHWQQTTHPASKGRRKRLLKRTVIVSIAVIVIAAILLHFIYMPLDILMMKIISRFG
jgi:hypothetical protein